MSDVFGIGGVASAVGSVASASISASATQKAADTYANAAKYSADLQQGRYDTTRTDLSPFLTSGQSATNALTGNQDAYANNGSDTVARMNSALPQSNLGGVQTPSAVDTSKIPSLMSQDVLKSTPGYQFTLDQGLKSVQNSAAARGLGVSGAAMKGAATYATGLADNTYQNQFNNLQTQFTDAYNRDNQNFNQGQSIFSDTVGLKQNQYNQDQNNLNNLSNIGTFQQSGLNSSYNRLAGIATLGENAGAQTGSVGVQTAQNAGNYLTSAAASSGNALISGANSTTGAINSLVNSGNQNSALNSLSGDNGTSSQSTLGSLLGGSSGGSNSDLLTALSYNDNTGAYSSGTLANNLMNGNYSAYGGSY